MPELFFNKFDEEVEMLKAKSFMPTVTSDSQLKELQIKGLQWTVNHAYNGSPSYKKKLDEASIQPDDIRSLDDLERLPLTTFEDLKEGYPFPLLSVPFEKVVRIHASSGTTGKRKVLCWYLFPIRSHDTPLGLEGLFCHNGLRFLALSAPFSPPGWRDGLGQLR